GGGHQPRPGRPARPRGRGGPPPAPPANPPPPPPPPGGKTPRRYRLARARGPGRYLGAYGHPARPARWLESRSKTVCGGAFVLTPPSPQITQVIVPTGDDRAWPAGRH